MKLVISEGSISHLKNITPREPSGLIWLGRASSPPWYGNWCRGPGPWVGHGGARAGGVPNPCGRFAGIGAYLAVATARQVNAATIGSVVVLVQRGKVTHMGVIASPEDHVNPARRAFANYRWLKIIGLRARMPLDLGELKRTLGIVRQLPVEMPGGSYNAIDAMEAVGEKAQALRTAIWEAFGFERDGALYVRLDDPGAVLGYCFPDELDADTDVRRGYEPVQASD